MTKHSILKANLKRWLACKNNKGARGEMTRTLASTLKMHPKSIGRAMTTLQLKRKKQQERRGRKKQYGKNVDAALYDIWDVMNRPCAEIMHPAIQTYVNAFLDDNSWHHDDIATGLLCSISLGTLKKKIGELRQKHDSVRGKSSTISSPLKGMIPIRKSHTWHSLTPGHLQTDTVVHCGDMLTDNVVYSVGVVDFRTYWIEYTAQWNKGQEATKDSLALLHDRCPLSWLELHPDTGNEFINYHVKRWADDNGIDMTRSEPYKKNDNMCIEERNGSIARKYLGYSRLDRPEMVSVASEILQQASLLHNHFIPVRRMTKKVRIGAKWHRTFEKVACTPYDRTINHPDVDEHIKTKLRAEHEALNPLALKRQLDELQKRLSHMIRNLNL